MSYGNHKGEAQVHYAKWKKSQNQKATSWIIRLLQYSGKGKTKGRETHKSEVSRSYGWGRVDYKGAHGNLGGVEMSVS